MCHARPSWSTLTTNRRAGKFTSNQRRESASKFRSVTTVPSHRVWARCFSHAPHGKRNLWHHASQVLLTVSFPLHGVGCTAVDAGPRSRSSVFDAAHRCLSDKRATGGRGQTTHPHAQGFEQDWHLESCARAYRPEVSGDPDLRAGCWFVSLPRLSSPSSSVPFACHPLPRSTRLTTPRKIFPDIALLAEPRLLTLRMPTFVAGKLQRHAPTRTKQHQPRPRPVCTASPPGCTAWPTRRLPTYGLRVTRKVTWSGMLHGGRRVPTARAYWWCHAVQAQARPGVGPR